MKATFIPDGAFATPHNPCESAFANDCDLNAECKPLENWNGILISDVKIRCTCNEGYESVLEDVSLEGKKCEKKKVAKPIDVPLIVMIILIVVLFIVILILSALVHKKRVSQARFNPGS